MRHTTTHLFLLGCLLRSSTATLRDEVLEQGGKRNLEDWLDGETNNAKSYGMILSGNPSTHVDAVHQVVANYPLFTSPGEQRNNSRFLLVSCEDSPEDCADIASTFKRLTKSTWCDNAREFVPGTCDLPHLVFMVSHAHQLPLSQVDLLVSKFFNVQYCTDPDRSFRFDCARVLFVLSTNFGERFILQSSELEKHPDALSVAEFFQTKRSFILQETYSEMRKVWHRQRVIQEIRLGYQARIIVGNPPATRVQELIERFDARREHSKLQFSVGATPDSSSSEASQIDLGVFARQGFVGQHRVIAHVKKALKKVRNGSKTGTNPLVFVFAGPAGTGKTFLSDLIAQSYNGGQSTPELELAGKYKKISMVNYRTKEDVDGFVGPRPGLQGSGILVDLFAKETRTVVAFDEIEKADPSFLEAMLLPMIDANGVVQDKKTGKGFPTKDAIFIFTTNCFDKQIMSLHAQHKGNYDKIVNSIDALFSSESLCRDETKNPFKNPDVRRRLVAGHQSKDSHGFVLFVPNTEENVQLMVDNAMEKQHYYHKRKFEEEGGKFSGLYWTYSASKKIQQLAKAKFLERPETTSLIESQVKNQLGDALDEAIELSPVRDSNREHKVVYSLDRNGGLIARLYGNADGVGWMDIGSQEYQDIVAEHRNDQEERQKTSGEANPSIESEEASTGGSSSQHAASNQSAVDLELDCEVETEEASEQDAEIARLVEEQVEQRIQAALEPYLKRIEDLEQELFFWKSFAYALSFVFSLFILAMFAKLIGSALLILKIATVILSLTVAVLYYLGYHELLWLMFSLTKLVLRAIFQTNWRIFGPLLLILLFILWYRPAKGPDSTVLQRRVRHLERRIRELEVYERRAQLMTQIKHLP